MAYWLVKQEPEAYSWADFVRDGHTEWTGVRNFQARNNLNAMALGDLVLYYHSVNGKEVMGIARVTKTAFPDKTAKQGDKTGDWVAVELAPEIPLTVPVTLETIKADGRLKDLALVRQGRLSVMPVTPQEFKVILELGHTSFPTA